MKNPSTRTVLFCLLVAASICSYVFLSFASSKSTSDNELGADLKMEKYEENMETEGARVVLPDVQLIKNIIQSGKRLLPAS